MNHALIFAAVLVAITTAISAFVWMLRDPTRAEIMAKILLGLCALTVAGLALAGLWHWTGTMVHQ